MGAPTPPVKPGFPSISQGDLQLGIQPSYQDLAAMAAGVAAEEVLLQLDAAAATVQSDPFPFPALLVRASSRGNALNSTMIIMLLREGVYYSIGTPPADTMASVLNDARHDAKLDKPIRIRKGDIIYTEDVNAASGNVTLDIGYIRLR